MRFLIDMPLSPSLAQWLNEKGHEAVHASHINLSQAYDEEVIDQARREKRIVVTADLDYPRLLALTGLKCPGLILFRGGNYSETDILKLMERVLTSVSEDDMPKSIVVADKTRIRRGHLPI